MIKIIYCFLKEPSPSLKERIYCILFVFCFCSTSFSQITLNAPVFQDTYVTGASSFPTNPTIQMSEFVLNKRKGAIQFDLSSIPYGSKIVSANFIFEGQAATGAAIQRQFEIQFTPFAWNQTGLTYGSTPWSNPSTGGISDMPAGLLVTLATAPVSFNINVTSHIDYMVCRKLSYGWMLEKKVGAPGVLSISSNDYLPITSRPKLIVVYYPPVDVTVATVPASGATTLDGSADITVSGGSGSFTYQWYDALGSPLVTTQDIASINPGLYKLQIIDLLSTEVFRYYVVVGDLQNVVTIDMQPEEAYSNDNNVRTANVFSLPGGSPIAEQFRNYPIDAFLRSGITTTTPYDAFLKFQYLGLEDYNNVLIESADLFLYGNGHINTGKGTNFKIKRVTQLWFENCITMVNQPPVTTSFEVNVNPGPTGTSPDVTKSILDFVKYHSQFPTQNFGYKLEWYPTGTTISGLNNYVNFHSSSSTTLLKRPKLSIKFRIKKDYAELKEKPDGSLYNIYGLLKFRYNEDYADTDGKLKYTIYKLSDNQPVVTEVIHPLNVQYGDNRYVINVGNVISGGLNPDVYMLEVTNEKKEKSFLRFKVN
jgi:hypothetical protein